MSAPTEAASPATDAGEAVSILMYHSIAEGPGPTRLPPAVFRDQLTALADAGSAVLPLADVAAWLGGTLAMPARAVVLTFDDGYRDFLDVAVPAMAARGWPSTVFLPAGRIGGRSDWPGIAPGDSQRLLDWSAAIDLHRAGVEIGSHAITHRDLTRLSSADAVAEIVDSRRMLEDGLGRPVATFAFPFGRRTPALRDAVARTYALAAGTDMRRTARDSDLHDLPRIDVTYFRNASRLRRFVERGGSSYFRARQVLRRARELVRG